MLFWGDPEQVETALEAIRKDAEALQEFREGVRNSSGTVSPTKTEQSLRAFLEINEFFPEEIEVVVRLSPHASRPLRPEERSALEQAARKKLGRGLPLDKTLEKRVHFRIDPHDETTSLEDVLLRITKFQKDHPDREVYFDGEEYAIASKPKASRRASVRGPHPRRRD